MENTSKVDRRKFDDYVMCARNTALLGVAGLLATVTYTAEAPRHQEMRQEQSLEEGVMAIEPLDGYVEPFPDDWRISHGELPAPNYMRLDAGDELDETQQILEIARGDAVKEISDLHLLCSTEEDGRDSLLGNELDVAQYHCEDNGYSVTVWSGEVNDTEVMVRHGWPHGADQEVVEVIQEQLREPSVL